MIAYLALLCLAVAGPRYEVVVFLGTECPMAKLYAGRLNELAERYPQITFRAVNCSQQDSHADVFEFGKRLRFPFEKDDGRLARRLGATRSPEAFLLFEHRVVYRGRIDDQYSPGTNRAEPTRRDLEEAIKDVLAGRAVAVPETKPTGCRLSLPAEQRGKVTFEQVAPILHRRCAECHRPGQVAPFSLLTYHDTVGWGPMIREVVENGRMPPWGADPRYGEFANDRSLRVDEKELLLRWLSAGAPPGEKEPIPPQFRDGWAIRPDLILTMEQPFEVPAEGVLDYQEFAVDPGFDCDTWIQGVEIRPGNRSVVHHINVYLRPKDAAPETLYLNAMNDYYLAMTVAGNAVTDWPEGIAKIVPAGWELVLSVHYQPNGSPQEDQSSIALQLADPSTVRQQVATRTFLKEDMILPPNRVTEVSTTWTLEDDYTLYALYPHMHLRGRSMQFEIVSPHEEVLLDVPKFDFNWQHRYVLAEPKLLRRGTIIRCMAQYDNTANNPNNPNPNAEVRHGRQTTDEMFQACFEIVRTHENRLASRSSSRLIGLAALGLVCLVTSVFLRRRRLQ
jgi:mono/diheme cytochrome c family protein